jgi:hypothetical protein
MEIRNGYPDWCPDLLQHCSVNVNRYKGLPRTLSAFPIIEKGEIVANYAAFIAGNLGIDQQELATVLNDEQRKRLSISEGTRWRNVVIEETSGTSGIPFNFPKMVAERAMAACEIWKWRRAIDPLVTSRTFYPFLHAPIGFVHPFAPSDTSPRNVADLYAYLSSNGTRWVHGPPEMLRQHAAVLRGLDRHTVTVNIFETTGLYLSEEARIEIESTGLTVVNQYGCRETWVVGYGVGSSSEFKILTRNVFVEIIDESGCAIGNHETVGDVVVTARFARLMPFIRYRTGDRGSWVPGGAGKHLRLANTEREQGAWRWGKWGSGSRFFRIMLSRAYMETGYIPMRILQIQETADSKFSIITDNTQRRHELCHTLERICATSAPRAHNEIFKFSAPVIDDTELARALAAKPCLFKPLPDTGSVHFAKYF